MVSTIPLTKKEGSYTCFMLY